MSQEVGEKKKKFLKVSFSPYNDKNIDQLRILNSRCLPIQYTSTFYQKALLYKEFSRFAYFNDIVVGGICCREEEEKGEITLYILTIGVFEPYRKFQIGTQLIDEIEKLAKADGKIKSIYLHVQINNETAINFYKKHGFVVEELLKDYYNDIEPADCYKLKKTF